MKNGDFSSLLGPTYRERRERQPGHRPKGAIYDPDQHRLQRRNGTPISRTPFPGNIIPQSRFDPAFAKILRCIRKPISRSSPATADPRLLLHLAGRPDHRSGRWPRRLPSERKGQPVRFVELVEHRQDQRFAFPGPSSPRWRRLQRRAGNRSEPQRADQLHARVEADSDFGNARQLHAPGDVAPRRESRIPICSSSSASAATIRPRPLPTMAVCRRSAISGYQQTGANDWIPTKEFNNVWDFVQNVALSKGSHSLKFGAEFRRSSSRSSRFPTRTATSATAATRPLSRPTTARPAMPSRPRCSARSTAATSPPPTSSLRRRAPAASMRRTTGR